MINNSHKSYNHKQGISFHEGDNEKNFLYNYTLHITTKNQSIWSFQGLIRALLNCPLLNIHPVL